MTTWLGETECNLCDHDIKSDGVGAELIDGATKMGPWAVMCTKCNVDYGIGLGTGRGQRYVLQDNGSFLKVEG